MISKHKKLLLIDANNLCYRVFWTHRKLSYNGESIALLYGFFRSLISLKKRYSDHFFIVAWDGGSRRRKEESQRAVEEGLIPSAYKANRKKDEIPEDLEAMFEQMDQLKEDLDMLRLLQVWIKGYEADDVIYSYVQKHKELCDEIVVVTSDKDFYQLLDDNVKIFDAMKDEVWSRERFVCEFDYEPTLWVDAGALSGDSSDNIFGVEGWGPVTTNKYVREFGGVDNILTAVALKDKKSKKEQKLLSSVDRIRVAKSLKQMDEIEFIPKIRVTHKCEKSLVEKYFLNYRFVTLVKDIWRLI